MRKAALLEALYTDPDDSEIKSIDVLMHRLRKRLIAAGADGLITTVWGAGYIVREHAAQQESVSEVASRDIAAHGANVRDHRRALAVH